VLDNVVVGLEGQGRPRKASVERAQTHIKLVGLSGFERH
jgi:ABC-type proline/glycine betaine transport system ATPase subunit